MNRTIRVRSLVWIALAVVSVLAASLMVARPWSASASPSSDDSATFVPVKPCRLFDYRPTPHTVGNRNVPLGPGEVYTQQVTGTVGDCNLPADASAVAMNVTIAQPTARSFLTIFPADVATVPTVSSLNWLAEQAPTPNKVDVQLSPTGHIKLYNRSGQVFVTADAVGYYAESALDDIRTELADRYHPISIRFTEGWREWTVGPDWKEIGAMEGGGIGFELGSASFTVVVAGDAEIVQCGFGRAPSDWLPPVGGIDPFDPSGSGWAEWQSPVGGGRTQLTIINSQPVGPSGSDYVWKLFCRNVDGGSATIKNVHLSVQSGDFGGDFPA